MGTRQLEPVIAQSSRSIFCTLDHPSLVHLHHRTPGYRVRSVLGADKSQDGVELGLIIFSLKTRTTAVTHSGFQICSVFPRDPGVPTVQWTATFSCTYHGTRQFPGQQWYDECSGSRSRSYSIVPPTVATFHQGIEPD